MRSQFNSDLSQYSLSEACWGKVAHVPLAEGNWKKMGESLVPGETLPGSHFISHMGQAGEHQGCCTLQRGFASQMAKGLQPWTAAGPFNFLPSFSVFSTLVQ